jgi:hypothetical protein
LPRRLTQSETLSAISQDSQFPKPSFAYALGSHLG